MDLLETGGALNSRERSIGRAHLPYCPRLRRTILVRSETVQITIRDTKDCFYLYEVPPSRVLKQVIGPRTPRSWLEHLDDESRDIVDFRRTRLWIRLLPDWDDCNCHGRCQRSVHARMRSPQTLARRTCSA